MSTALYRRYRPDRFEDVIGQDHVTVPLRTALSKDRVNHAYLFSGPRGCGKTTSARILARCLNCAQGPTPTPCGECESCRDLATGGPGSLDVLEIDAASHGGVEDARGLRERATFAPVRDRYKIMIIDEAHMVTAAGFNALLKIVEEPPEHLKFIFATTEPEKVIGTIRSRTHHYPFRLVPPEPLIAYLERLCAEEQVRVEPGVLPLVVRAGTGSVRDTLSVLDQLIAGAQHGAVTYDLAVSLLGFTPEALLDDVIDAVAADDTPTVFRVVDRVVQSGQDPRRFVEDLLDRFRDLVIARALPDEAGAILHGMPEDQVRRLSAQAAQLSRAELSRLADVTNLALTDMVGATSPRLHLELLMARLVLPATDDTHRGLSARVEALERRLEYGGVPTAGGAPSAPATPSGQAAPSGDRRGEEPPGPASPGDGGALSGAALARAAMRRTEAAAPASPASVPAPGQDDAAPAPAPERGRAADVPTAPERAASAAEAEKAMPRPAQATAAPTSPAPSQAQPKPQAQTRGPGQDRPQTPAPSPSASSPSAASPAPANPGTSPVEMVRRAWPEILGALEDSSRLVWMLVKDNATVAGYDGSLLTVGFEHDGPRQSLLGRGGDRVLAEAVHRVLGIRPELDLILGGDAPRPQAAGQQPAAAQRPAAPLQPQAQAQAQAAPARDERPHRQPGQGSPQGQSPRQEERPAQRPQPTGQRQQRHNENQNQNQNQPRPSAPDGPATEARPAPPRPQGEAPRRPGPSERPDAARRPHPETTPPAAPPAHGWGAPDEEPPAWDDAPPPPEDPWDSLPEFDPDSDMEDSPGPDGWTPPPGTDTEDAPAWGGPVPSPSDWGAPTSASPVSDRRQESRPQSTAEAGAAPGDARQEGAPSQAPEGSGPAPEGVDAETARRAYDPGPLVREPSIPVFAKPEAELRAEFEARFGATRPSGFDAGARGGSDGGRPTRADAPAASPRRQDADGTPPGQDDDPAASEREDPHPAAAASATSSDAHPTPQDSPDEDVPAPGVPDEDHAEADARDGAPSGAHRGSGHPASMFGRLMERLEAGGPLDPPVNAGAPGQGGTAATPATPASGRPSPSALGAPRADAPAAPTPPALDPRAAAIQAAREAAQGRGPARPAASPSAAEPAAVDWSDEVASEDDVALEDSGLVGRAVVERVLGARLLEEHPLDAG